MSYPINILGNKYRTMTVMSKKYVLHEHQYWEVKCSICGYEKTVSGSSLISGSGAGCNECIAEKRWTIDKPTRLQICVDYISGLSNKDICEKYNIKLTNKSVIYNILKKHKIPADRNRRLTIVKDTTQGN